jgi:hypothetical protein
MLKSCGVSQKSRRASANPADTGLPVMAADDEQRGHYPLKTNLRREIFPALSEFIIGYVTVVYTCHPVISSLYKGYYNHHSSSGWHRIRLAFFVVVVPKGSLRFNGFIIITV